MDDLRRFAAATQRNREPILKVLGTVVAPGSRVLEIASGSGEHAVFLAPRLHVAQWQPTDMTAEACASIDAWRAADDHPNVLPALVLDVERDTWPNSAVDAVVCINMIHIAPWSATLGLLEGAARLLSSPGATLFLYGPYRRGGEHTAPSNAAFDAGLRERDPRWGVRDLEAVVEAAAEVGLGQADVVEMPANNLSLILRRP